ncbi:MAG: DUF4212 domain-containing protein [Bacteroidales bacterium]|nr:DUF4212 domain-containing protein [Bacteroidales bacterium]MBN2756119.1 DUF4212 domain-containing protein [Bacteroidales bacterium]
METKSDNYNISFFKPTTELARINRNLTIKLLLIWVIAIFGFQILLRIIEKPTPEPAYIAYKQVWDKIKSENASYEENQVFLKSALSVLGKLSVNTDDKIILDKIVSSVSYKLIPEEKKENFINEVIEFNKIKSEITSLSDNKYVVLKTAITSEAASFLGVKDYSLEAKLIPFELIPENMKRIDIQNNELVEGVMSKYLIHNQSFLTDFKFLSFPFHYFYTAVFLLILFVGICWFYCYKTDKIHEKLGIEA